MSEEVLVGEKEEKEEKLTPEKVAQLYQVIPHMTDDQKRKALEKIRIFRKEWIKEHGKDSFLDFILHVYPGYKIGDHHRKDRKSTRLNSSHSQQSRMPSSA